VPATGVELPGARVAGAWVPGTWTTGRPPVATGADPAGLFARDTGRARVEMRSGWGFAVSFTPLTKT
jgi:hypothetical protein